MDCDALPYFTKGLIVKGFGRGSKELGFPTANYSEEVVNSLPKSVGTGIYFGWAQVDESPIYKMVMSVGWNPFYSNKTKTMETHILHKFDGDLYGRVLKTCMLGYIRPEKNFNSVDELIAEINNDIEIASNKLDEPELLIFNNNSFFCDKSQDQL